MPEISTLPLSSSANLIAYYRFNTGALTTDSKNSNTLTNNNTVGETASGKFGFAADFGASNTNKYFSRASSIAVDLSTNASVSFWVKVQTEPSAATFRLIDWRSTTGTTNRMIISYTDTAGTKTLTCNSGSGTLSHTVTLGTTLYHHVVITYGASDAVIMYLNGSNVANHTKTNAGAGNALAIGADTSGNSPSSIFMDDVAFFDKTLTPTEVSDIYLEKQSGYFFMSY